jgi:serine protease Do
MKRDLFATVGFIGLGVIIGIMLINIALPDSLGSLFAQTNGKIGAAQPPVQANPTIKALNDAFVEVSNAVNPVVVSIAVEMEGGKNSGAGQDEFREFFKFFGHPDLDDTPRRSEASGSGVIISTDGYIITNNHVVENAMEDGITVTLFDKKVFKKARLVGRDPLTDLAVIKIEATGLPTAHLGNRDEIKVGDIVFAVGNPLGLNSTVTSGIISAIGRGQLNLMNKDRYSVENFIQTDAAINPGNSGGGLFNIEGSLIGINSAIATQTGTYIGYGFAIPVDLVQAVVVDLIEDGKVDRGYIGVSIKSVDATEAKALGLNNVEGVMVQEVLKDSPAEKAGIEIGDVILQLNGTSVKTANELQSIIASHRSGDEVKLTIWRDGKKLNKSVKLKKRDEEESVTASAKGESPKKTDEKVPYSFSSLGFTVSPMDSKAKEDNDVSNGVIISKVDRYSPAAERGLTPDGIIVKADKQKVTSVEDLKKVLDGKKPGDGVLLQVKYKDTYRLIALEVPETKQ